MEGVLHSFQGNVQTITTIPNNKSKLFLHPWQALVPYYFDVLSFPLASNVPKEFHAASLNPKDAVLSDSQVWFKLAAMYKIWGGKKVYLVCLNLLITKAQNEKEGW